MLDPIKHMITDSQDPMTGLDMQADRPAGAPAAEPLEVVGQQRLAEQLVAQARAQGLDLAGADGLLARS